jgi:hypothetical protein
VAVDDHVASLTVEMMPGAPGSRRGKLKESNAIVKRERKAQKIRDISYILN